MMRSWSPRWMDIPHSVQLSSRLVMFSARKESMMSICKIESQKMFHRLKISVPKITMKKAKSKLHNWTRLSKCCNESKWKIWKAKLKFTSSNLPSRKTTSRWSWKLHAWSDSNRPLSPLRKRLRLTIAMSKLMNSSSMRVNSVC